ncbi:MAG TPA: acyltransferase domain-containing protein, partial [Polyangiaceae bacterium]|nr:acyltransferase domain-containing protein [Polyangiaceae bacterium]
MTDALAARLEQGVDLADAAYTLQLGRRAFPHRRAVVGRSSTEAARALRARDGSTRLGLAAGGPRPVVFLFPGQGSQYPNMGRGAYETEPVFRTEVDECARRLGPALGLDVRTLLFPAPADAARAAAALVRTSLAQPALFTIEYALARLWASWGLTPEATLGHSVGEYVSACVGGCLALEDALALVAARGRLMETTAEGAMLAVAASEDDARAWLGDELDVAAVNAPRQCVLSGPAAAIERLARDLAGRGVRARRLPTTRAFHSRLMDGILREFTEEVARVRLRAPQTPWVSNLTGTWVTPAEAQDPGYWARHLRGAVRFADGVRTLWARPERILLEVGPGQALSRLCRQVGAAAASGEAEPLAFGSLSAEAEAAGASAEGEAAGASARGEGEAARASARGESEAAGASAGGEGEAARAGADGDEAALLDAAAQLWVAGAPLSFSGLRGERRGRRVPLPATPFEHQ